MRHRLRRAGAFAVVASAVLAAPALGPAAAAPFAAVAVLAAFVVDEGRFFDLFARPGDYEDRRLNGLAGFALAATALGVLTALPQAPMPVSVYAASALSLAYGVLAREVVRESTTDEFATTTAFAVGAFAAATLGQAAVAVAADSFAPGAVPTYVFLAAVAALVAALLRSVLFPRDDPIVMVSVGVLLWIASALVTAGGVSVTPTLVVVGLVLSTALGLVSYVLETASVSGMLTGVLLAFVTVVLGGLGWFVVLISFFGIGGLAAKFRFTEKDARGVAEGNDGARGAGNVLGNAGVALVAVIAFAAARAVVPGTPVPTLVAFAFAGSVATAMADTLSSEFGGLFDAPRLVTTLRPVDPGTDGAITWQGEVVGVAGAGLVAALAALLMPLGDAPLAAIGSASAAAGSTAGAGGGALVTVPVAVAVTGAGFVGMTVDSLLGATVEGDRLGNQAVNTLATLSGGFAGVALSVVTGAAALPSAAALSAITDALASVASAVAPLASAALTATASASRALPALL
ncbi:DUF92 domain-containing protein [Halobaculum gomorrense]|uniref:TIGR00297 family protein n=1 Tax=Halobaculum gomorrense TaxID=43928 RepID=A0A1M5MW34_9EURY|nr:DUF92 domain-containing protein [Halobaculum gomorrense]SHG81427.1 TIGR00297 family protein [Halobaculum gomorrense]